ncbi:transposase [Pontibacter mangrovi]|uniref:Transposase IS200-like domain-containing protein n=1 Tax=Pontibacter mangrovi TaxID=2589816 RepID=A0A501W9V4_9BACT|nr:transposase [Pontibacter mangrovi]TPE46389.1 hypothetical protein FJM65_03340 [Pontibacter mangrovi]
MMKLLFACVVRYRKKLLNGSIPDDPWQNIQEASQQKGYRVDAMQRDGNHLHVML